LKTKKAQPTANDPFRNYRRLDGEPVRALKLLNSDGSLFLAPFSCLGLGFFSCSSLQLGIRFVCSANLEAPPYALTPQAKMVPTILFVPGFWEGPGPFTQVSSLLETQNYSTFTVALPSTGTVSPSNPSMLDDIATVRTTVEKLVVADLEVVMVLHSAGGFLGSNAIEGLDVKTRGEKGLKGGVTKLVILAGALWPEGFKHGPLPFSVYNGGSFTCATPEKLLFNDLDEAEAGRWIQALKTQPTDWDDTVTYCGWRHVPSVYLVCEADAVIPISLQLQFAEAAGSRIEKCGAGHMPMLSMPEKVVEVIRSAVETT